MRLPLSCDLRGYENHGDTKCEYSRGCRKCCIGQKRRYMEWRARQRVEALRKSGQDVSYPLVPLTVLDNFSAFVRDDIAFRDGAKQ